jgi:hypothetical protein
MRTLEAEAARPAPPAAPSDPPAKFHFFVLGLVAVSRQVSALAERGRQEAALPAAPPPPPAPPVDLLR